MEPDKALKKTAASEMLVINSVFSFGYINRRIGTRMKPPPAPIKVPKQPTTKPKGSNHRYCSSMFPSAIGSAHEIKSDVKLNSAA